MAGKSGCLAIRVECLRQKHILVQLYRHLDLPQLHASALFEVCVACHRLPLHMKYLQRLESSFCCSLNSHAYTTTLELQLSASTDAGPQWNVDRYWKRLYQICGLPACNEQLHFLL